MTNREQSVLDDIDALVDEQMAGGEPIGGYDYNDPDYPKCPHCHRDWHGLAITDRIEQMRWNGVMDQDYRYADDDSTVLCPGSDFIGPVRPVNNPWSLSSYRGWQLPSYTWPRAVAREEIPPDSLAPGLLFLHRALLDDILADADLAFTHRPWLNAPDINDGDRVAVVMGRRRFEGIAAVSGPAVDPNRPWLIEQHVQLADVREVPNEIRGFTTGPVIFDETHVFDDEDFRRAVETPQQRALPRPAAQPPMWANDPARTHRTRNRARNVRTPRI